MKTILNILIVFLSFNLSAQQQPIETINRTVNGKLKVFGKNNTLFVYSAKFDIQASNCKPNKKLPIIVVIPPNSEIELFEVIPFKNKKWKYGTTSSYMLGNIKAKPNTSFRYSLPYAKGNSFSVNQGYYGTFSHQQKFALDFTMPEGTPLHAIRGGMVIKLKKDSNTGCPSKKCEKDVNFIWIEHEDGTIAEYAHLQLNGTHLKLGDVVEKGDEIGLSGNTGFSQAPHLHLEVFVQNFNGKRKTIPTKFEVDTNKVVELKKGDNYVKQ